MELPHFGRRGGMSWGNAHSRRRSGAHRQSRIGLAYTSASWATTPAACDCGSASGFSCNRRRRSPRSFRRSECATSLGTTTSRLDTLVQQSPTPRQHQCPPISPSRRKLGRTVNYLLVTIYSILRRRASPAAAGLLALTTPARRNCSAGGMVATLNSLCSTSGYLESSFGRDERETLRYAQRSRL
jgi:hypothetical protein